MRQHEGPGGGQAPAGWERGSDPGGHGQTPGQLRAEALTRTHALAVLADEVARTGHDLAGCREDPAWSGRAHDAFAASLDELARRVALAAALLRDVRPASEPAPGCRP